MHAEDEFRRRGHFTRVLPCDDMEARYLPFFEFARYKNTVLSKWMDAQVRMLLLLLLALLLLQLLLLR